jgi:predicted enzyme related to lactoylglutathione lyase
MALKSICGVILMSTTPEALARFYGAALLMSFEREEHAGLAPHFGADIGAVHFGIHPPENFDRTSVGKGSAVIAFDVESVAECRDRLARLGSKCLLPPHDEGSGLVALFEDPEGNLFEVVELNHEFEMGGEHRGLTDKSASGE